MTLVLFPGEDGNILYFSDSGSNIIRYFEVTNLVILMCSTCLLQDYFLFVEYVNCFCIVLTPSALVFFFYSM